MDLGRSDNAHGGRGGGLGGGVVGEVLAHRPFVVCAALLLCFAITFQLLGSLLKWQHRKLALPLQKSLAVLDKQKLEPYQLLQAAQIKAEMLDELGTDQYIQWYMRDASQQGPERPEDYILLFVTYYTGKPDQVPHVPEECYVGGAGFEVKDASFLDVPVPALGPGAVVPVQVLELATPARHGGHSRIVMYTFHTNGQFCAHRRCVQEVLADPAHKHAYFSKLELTFGTPDRLPSKEEAIASGQRFLQTVLPVLLSDHWPNWDQVVTAERAGQTQSSH